MEIRKKVTQYNLRIFKNFGFRIGEDAIVPIEKWDKKSHEKIEVKCDICNLERIIPYREYINSFEKYNVYSCSSKCSQFKNRITKNEKYGNEYYHNEEKYKKTCLERHGVDNPFKDKNIIINIDKTKRDRYGENLELIVEKMKNSINSKYGVDNISKLGYIKQIKKEKSLENYGVDYPLQSEEIKRKIKETMIKDGKWFKINTSEFNLYRRLIISETKRNIKLLNWDGYDYYDGEFILNNLELDYNSPEYPTIDHKTSVRYGFENKIYYKEIASIKNLCYTKRKINSSKHKKCEEDFIKRF